MWNLISFQGCSSQVPIDLSGRDDLPILALTCLLVHRLEEMGPPPKLEVGERGGLVLDPDRVRTDVIV